MLTYLPPERRASESAREYPWLLMLLVFAWLWAGVFSHDLWNPQEPQIYTVIRESQNPFLPTLFGEPYFQVAPVYVWLGAWMRYLLSPWATDVYSATRFATVIFTVIGLTGSGFAGYRLLGASHGRSTVLILIGSAGLLSMGHFLSTMSVAFAGVGLCLWGFSVVKRQAAWAAFLLSMGGWFIAQCLGWLMAGGVLLTALLLCLTSQWRDTRFGAVLLGSAVMTCSLAAIQPIVLAKLNPDALSVYWHSYWLGGYGGLDKIHAELNVFYYLKQILWFAFPAYPLAIWTYYRGKPLQTHWGVLCTAWLGVFGALLAVHPVRFQDNLIVLLPVLAILGAAQLDHLRRGVAAFLNWFGIMAFGAVAVFLWVGFVAMNYGFPAKLAERAAYFSPFYTRDIDIMPIVVAVLFTPAWIFAITRKRIRGRQAVSNWAAGMTLAWALLLTLFLPWLDAAKSFRPVVQQMERALPHGEAVNCIAIAPELTAARIAWQEYSTLHTVSDANQSRCAYRLVEYNPQEITYEVGKQNVIWQGKRPRQKNKAFALIKQ